MTGPKVVIVGGGFGGLAVAKSLAKAPIEVSLIDRSNHHLFQPLLYQVAMAGLSPAEIALPIRSILSGAPRTEVLLGEVVHFDLTKKLVALKDGAEFGYDYLVVAAGARTHYFGHDDWAPRAPGLKSVEDAIEIRRRILMAFERAERLRDPAQQAALLSFVVIGGGPTGVELAGALSELARRVLAKDFRHIDARQTRVTLIEGGPRILPSFDESLSAKATRALVKLGVEVRTDAKVESIDPGVIRLSGGHLLQAETVLWAAGVGAHPLGRALGAPVDKGGRVIVEPDCSVPGHPEVFVIGDLAHFVQDGKQLPGVSPVAMQMGRYVASRIRAQLDQAPAPGPFRYFDKGSMATIGRSQAVAEVGRLKLSGFFAWITWLFIHIWYLVGFKNRVFVLLQWIFSYVVYRRGARLITRQDIE
jgi:NADH dehydrogenase